MIHFDGEAGRVGLQFKRRYENHNMKEFKGWNNLRTTEDRIEWLNNVDGDENLNIRMLVK